MCVEIHVLCTVKVAHQVSVLIRNLDTRVLHVRRTRAKHAFQVCKIHDKYTRVILHCGSTCNTRVCATRVLKWEGEAVGAMT